MMLGSKSSPTLTDLIAEMIPISMRWDPETHPQEYQHIFNECKSFFTSPTIVLPLLKGISDYLLSNLSVLDPEGEKKTMENSEARVRLMNFVIAQIEDLEDSSHVTAPLNFIHYYRYIDLCRILSIVAWLCASDKIPLGENHHYYSLHKRYYELFIEADLILDKLLASLTDPNCPLHENLKEPIRKSIWVGTRDRTIFASDYSYACFHFGDVKEGHQAYHMASQNYLKLLGLKDRCIEQGFVSEEEANKNLLKAKHNLDLIVFAFHQDRLFSKRVIFTLAMFEEKFRSKLDDSAAMETTEEVESIESALTGALKFIQDKNASLPQEYELRFTPELDQALSEAFSTILKIPKLSGNKQKLLMDMIKVLTEWKKYFTSTESSFSQKIIIEKLDKITKSVWSAIKREPKAVSKEKETRADKRRREKAIEKATNIIEKIAASPFSHNDTLYDRNLRAYYRPLLNDNEFKRIICEKIDDYVEKTKVEIEDKKTNKKAFYRKILTSVTLRRFIFDISHPFDRTHHAYLHLLIDLIAAELMRLSSSWTSENSAELKDPFYFEVANNLMGLLDIYRGRYGEFLQKLNMQETAQLPPHLRCIKESIPDIQRQLVAADSNFAYLLIYKNDLQRANHYLSRAKSGLSLIPPGEMIESRDLFSQMETLSKNLNICIQMSALDLLDEAKGTPIHSLGTFVQRYGTLLKWDRFQIDLAQYFKNKQGSSLPVLQALSCVTALLQQFEAPSVHSVRAALMGAKWVELRKHFDEKYQAWVTTANKKNFAVLEPIMAELTPLAASYCELVDISLAEDNRVYNSAVLGEIRTVAAPSYYSFIDFYYKSAFLCSHGDLPKAKGYFEKTRKMMGHIFSKQKQLDTLDKTKSDDLLLNADKVGVKLDELEGKLYPAPKVIEPIEPLVEESKAEDTSKPEKNVVKKERKRPVKKSKNKNKKNKNKNQNQKKQERTTSSSSTSQTIVDEPEDHESVEDDVNSDADDVDEVEELTEALENVSLHRLDLSPLELPPEVLDILPQIRKGGYWALVVGGAVRDGLLKREGSLPIFVNDYDLVTNCQDVTALVTGAFKNRHKERLFNIKNCPWIQIFSSEHPTMELDALSRDFTINALYADENGIYDPLSKYDDLFKDSVEVIGDPLERIKEDPLRWVRMLKLTYHTSKTMGEKNTKVLKKTAQYFTTMPYAVYISSVETLFRGQNAFKNLAFMLENKLLSYLFSSDPSRSRFYTDEFKDFWETKISGINYFSKDPTYEILAVLMCAEICGQLREDKSLSLSRCIDLTIGKFSTDYKGKHTDDDMRTFKDLIRLHLTPYYVEYINFSSRKGHRTPCAVQASHPPAITYMYDNTVSTSSSSSSTSAATSVDYQSRREISLNS